ncbi:hypothetical protein [Cytobacillus oceanisediminis]|uniref:Uncharacterized protein n=1 Tax=Cytobacillus oceanisediminis TaxID=665099 RepID=A0A562JTN2_9BACI|nr:hypothetical protein [Cytobacillus oceanisediminis]TWH86526.1 hypothetical protein IQ19_02548 [Cytobacillus oceanisediminis]
MDKLMIKIFNIILLILAGSVITRNGYIKNQMNYWVRRAFYNFLRMAT